MRLALAFLLSMWLAACSDDEMRTGQPPWHMWGDTKIVEAVAAGPGGVPVDTNQITRIEYKRPENWRWTWRVDILEATTAGGETPDTNLVVDLDVITGVGRASTQITIGRFAFVSGGALPVVPLSGASKWAVSTNGPNPDDTVIVVPAATPLQNYIDHFVGQDIQVQCRSQFFGPTGSTVKFAVTALFAPNTHVRPEWFTDVGQFNGNEDKSGL